jgi:hypothetical protein
LTKRRQGVILRGGAIAPNLAETAVTKEFSAKVPEEEYDRFVKNTGGTYGATTWFITTALRMFNDRMEQHPTAQEDLQAAINSFLVERKTEART